MDRHTAIIVLLFLSCLSWSAKGIKQGQLQLVEKLSEDVEKLQTRIGYLEEIIQDLVKERGANNYIGFTAYSSVTLTVGGRGQVVMDSTLTNYGGYFSGGEFGCPVSGLYYFSVTSRGVNDDWGMVMIMLDDTELTTAFSDYDTRDSGTNAVIIECNQGSKVSLKNPSDGNIVLLGGKESSFVGYLVQLAA